MIGFEGPNPVRFFGLKRQSSLGALDLSYYPWLGDTSSGKEVRAFPWTWFDFAIYHQGWTANDYEDARVIVSKSDECVRCEYSAVNGEYLDTQSDRGQMYVCHMETAYSLSRSILMNPDSKAVKSGFWIQELRSEVKLAGKAYDKFFVANIVNCRKTH